MFAISGEAYAPTYYNTGYLGYPGLRFGESNVTFLECRSGIFNLKEHTIISVSKSNASTQLYGRLLILGIPSVSDDYTVPYGEVLSFDNDGSRSFRVNAGGPNYALYIATSVLEQVPTGIFSYRISTKKDIGNAKITAGGSILTNTATTTYVTSGTGLAIGCHYRDSIPIITSDIFYGDNALMAIFPKGLTDGVIDLIIDSLKKDYDL